MNKEFNVNKIVRRNVAQMKAYSSARDEFKADSEEMIFLDANENPNETGLNRYPDPQQSALKQLLARTKKVDSGQILLGNGSDEVLDLVFRAFCEPTQDNVITLPPTYGMYKVLANLNDIEDREVVLKPDFQPNVSAILEQVDQNTKIIFLCSPNNPTGNSFSETAVSEILNGFSGLVVIDEAYIDFAEGKSWLSRLQEFPNLVITQTFSKAYGLAGIRLGACYASEGIISILNKIKPPYNVNELSQQRAAGRLENKDAVEAEIRKILDQKQYMAEELSKLSIVEQVFPSDANFLLVRVDKANLRYQQLLGRKMVVRNRSNQVLCENTLRITIGTEKENERLLIAMRVLDKEE